MDYLKLVNGNKWQIAGAVIAGIAGLYWFSQKSPTPVMSTYSSYDPALVQLGTQTALERDKMTHDLQMLQTALDAQHLEQTTALEGERQKFADYVANMGQEAALINLIGNIENRNTLDRINLEGNIENRNTLSQLEMVGNVEGNLRGILDVTQVAMSATELELAKINASTQMELARIEASSGGGSSGGGSSGGGSSGGFVDNFVSGFLGGLF